MKYLLWNIVCEHCQLLCPWNMSIEVGWVNRWQFEKNLISSVFKLGVTQPAHSFSSFLRDIANVRYLKVLDNINNINIMLMRIYQHELISIPGKLEPSVTLYR